jgi:hypothetical protein
MAMSERLFAAGLEQLSGTVGQIRADAKSRLDRLEQQYANANKSARFNTDALGRALDRIEASVNQRALDQVESQRRAAQVEQRFSGLEESLAGLKTSLPGVDFSSRLDAIEQAVGTTATQPRRNDLFAQFESSFQVLAGRLEALEQGHRRLEEDLRERLAVSAGPRACEFRPGDKETTFVEPPDLHFEVSSEDAAGPADYFNPIGPAFDEISPWQKEGAENFLSRARDAVRAIPEKPKARYVVPILGASLLVMLLATGLASGERGEEQPATGAAASPPMRTFSVPEPPGSGLDDTLYVVAPQANAELAREEKGHGTPPIERNEPSPDSIVQMANSGNVTALTILGLRALDDTGAAPVNLKDAVRFLTRAAEKGQAVAQFRLGSLYEHAEGVAADPAKAAHWYELAATRGNRKAMHNLAVFYAAGVLGKRDMREAARWFAKAAALGLTDSQFNLAFLYEHGDGVPQSLLEAYKWYSTAAAGGDSESKARVAVLQSQISSADKATAAKLAATFHAAPLDADANKTPLASNL